MLIIGGSIILLSRNGVLEKTSHFIKDTAKETINNVNWRRREAKFRKKAYEDFYKFEVADLFDFEVKKPKIKIDPKIIIQKIIKKNTSDQRSDQRIIDELKKSSRKNNFQYNLDDLSDTSDTDDLNDTFY